MNKKEYLALRNNLLENNGERIVRIEKSYTRKFHEVLVNNFETFKFEFDLHSKFYPFWANYPPRQKGGKPVGDSIPWTEVGQTSLTFNIIRFISNSELFESIMFPGLPQGSDLRFMTDDSFIHFDIKVAGPRDDRNVIVASSNQISGPGNDWNDKGIKNCEVTISSPRKVEQYEPELPPFYIYNGEIKICLTFFLKAVYDIIEAGKQPLTYLELVCVPNGLLLFEGPKYAFKDIKLITAGKDSQKRPPLRSRKRIYLDPLSKIAGWRTTKYLFYDSNSNIVSISRSSRTPPQFD